MPRRPKPPPSHSSPQDSVRWRTLFANVEQAQSLVDNPAFQKMLADLLELEEALVSDVVHNTHTIELTNFFRGQIAILERLRELPLELKDWKETR